MTKSWMKYTGMALVTGILVTGYADDSQAIPLQRVNGPICNLDGNMYGGSCMDIYNNPREQANICASWWGCEVVNIYCGGESGGFSFGFDCDF